MLTRDNGVNSLFLCGAAVPALLLASCHTATPTSPPVTPVQPAVVNSSASPSDGAPKDKAPKQVHKFEGDAAFAILKKQCDFGPRPIGSEAHEKCLAYLLAEMRKYADETITQKFNYKSGSLNLPNTNVIGIFYAAGTNKPSDHPVLLMTHWDTRPIADGPYSSEIKRGVQFRFTGGKWHPVAPILGASDAASGVGVLLELAKMFKAHPPPCGVIMLLDDGEDYGDFQGAGGDGDGVELGAHYFADHYKDRANAAEFGQPSFGILLDMVGGTDAIFPREDLSETNAKRFDDLVFAKAHELGYDEQFPSDKTQSVGDDHVWTNKAGIPTIDIIHPLPYGPYLESGYTHWHTLQDTPDHCSSKTLKAVGDVVAGVIYDQSP